MLRDKKATPRLELGQQIGQKEQQYDDLNQEKRSILNQIDNFQNQMEQSFRREEEHIKHFKQADAPLEWENVAFQEVRKAIQRISNNQSEQLEQDYRLENNQLQEEIETLHKERTALAWD